ncbi:hypothetical protein ACS0TY_025905 [Phlomoides rotata]
MVDVGHLVLVSTTAHRYNSKSEKDYSEMSQAYMPSHADATYNFKYEIAHLVNMANGYGFLWLTMTISACFFFLMILAYVSQVHNVVLLENLVDHDTVALDQIESSIARCPNPEYAEKMIGAIDVVRVKGDSVGGGVATCIVRNVPWGLGSPVFDKLEAELAKVALSLKAGMDKYGMVLSINFKCIMDHIHFHGGISNGETMNMRIAFKPTSTISRKQNTVTRDKHDTKLIARGRHDPCVVPRFR